MVSRVRGKEADVVAELVKKFEEQRQILHDLRSKVEEVYRFHLDYLRCRCTFVVQPGDGSAPTGINFRVPIEAPAVVEPPAAVAPPVVVAPVVVAPAAAPIPVPKEPAATVPVLIVARRAAMLSKNIPSGGMPSVDGDEVLQAVSEGKVALSDTAYEYQCTCGKKCKALVEVVVKGLNNRRDRSKPLRRRDLCGACNHNRFTQAAKKVTVSPLTTPLKEIATFKGTRAAKLKSSTTEVPQQIPAVPTAAPEATT